MSALIQIAKSIPARLRRDAIRLALQYGLREPRVQYPFAEVMLRQNAGRAPYRWGTYCSAFIARHLGYERISVIEFGVAAGGGLIELERIANEVARAAGIGIDVYGFDTGTGLTKPLDYRDLPQLWNEGDYRMDADKLRARLKHAQLILGPVEKTVGDFIASKPAPVGFISFDMDMYSSTIHAFELFKADASILLPRVHCYFDDIIGFSHGDFNGERLAVSDFNLQNERRKISPIYGLRHVLDIDRVWTEMMYLFHAFDHSRYNDFDGSNFIRDIPME